MWNSVSLTRFSQNLQSLYPVSGCVRCKNLVEFAQGVMELWGFKFTRSGYPQIFCGPYRRNYASDPKSFRGAIKNVFDVLYHHAKFGWARISPAAGAAKNVDFFVCLSVCLFVLHVFERLSLCARFRHEGVGLEKRF